VMAFGTIMGLRAASAADLAARPNAKAPVMVDGPALLATGAECALCASDAESSD
jgi:hypothetical protein